MNTQPPRPYFWPDIDVTEGATPLVAIEVKLIRADDPASKALAEVIGQAISYSVRYPHVFAFVVHYGRSDTRLHDEDQRLEKRLIQYNVETIIRRAPNDRSAG